MPAITLLALDCGGTRCRALAQSADGTIVAEREGGPANWAATPRHELQGNLKELLEGLHADVGVVCMAGILTPEDKQELATLLNTFTPATWHAFPDTESSLAACDDPNAICVISGTGSGVCSYNDAHQMVKSGGGGPLIGDVGSGFHTGRTALSRFLVSGAELPRLQEKLDAEYGNGGIQTWLATIYATPSPQTEIAKVGSIAAALATDGDETCQSILAEAMQALADLTLQHMHAQGFPERQFKIYLSGGFWEASPFIPKLFTMLLRTPTYRPRLSPLQGAMKLAQSLANS